MEYFHYNPDKEMLHYDGKPLTNEQLEQIAADIEREATSDTAFYHYDPDAELLYTTDGIPITNEYCEALALEYETMTLPPEIAAAEAAYLKRRNNEPQALSRHKVAI